MSARPDEPLDLAAVSADDRMLDALRLRAVSPDAPEPLDDDAAFALLRDLLADVGLGLDSDAAPEPVVAPLAARRARRLLRGGSTVAAVTAGVLALGGVAAAATLSPAGTPLHGLGEAVRAAVGAVTGGEDASPAAAPTAAASTSPRSAPTSVPGPADVAVERRAEAADLVLSRAAAAAVDRWLDDAQAALDAGRTAPAAALLDRAAARLPQVSAQDGAQALAQRLEQLRERLAADAPSREKTTPAGPDAERGEGPDAPAGGQDRAERDEAGRDEPARDEPTQDVEADAPEAEVRTKDVGKPKG